MLLGKDVAPCGLNGVSGIAGLAALYAPGLLRQLIHSLLRVLPNVWCLRWCRALLRDLEVWCSVSRAA